MEDLMRPRPHHPVGNVVFLAPILRSGDAMPHQFDDGEPLSTIEGLIVAATIGCAGLCLLSLILIGACRP
jgi:hypothetical protein